MDVFFRGLIIGISIAAPVGPIGILCIRRTLIHGRLAGVISGLGAATADAVYGCIAGFSVTIVSNVLIEQKFWIRLAGGTFLLYLGIKTFLAKTSQDSCGDGRFSFVASYVSILFLTLTNPMTIISFAAIFAALGVGSVTQEYRSAGYVVAGVFTGSMIWWLTLSTLVGLLRNGISVKGFQCINRIAGLIIFGFGLTALISVIR
ncbi:lysine transporter LysE [candidate division WOR_3 bacterium SM1_77]|uniref:Lysine transporter LysE n=1 Tax=candidate division WOR_3 bacterium SM1_77 TaxID=1703778 RepID=A0A0S8K3R6_UNCW3|nr:MAG: lysine transporter LysE [candidate division WOR_3 bacterium SM1_77]